MVTSLTVVGFFVAFAWAQQMLLNQIFEADHRVLQKPHNDSLKKCSDPEFE